MDIYDALVDIYDALVEIAETIKDVNSSKWGRISLQRVQMHWSQRVYNNQTVYNDKRKHGPMILSRQSIYEWHTLHSLAQWNEENFRPHSSSGKMQPTSIILGPLTTKNILKFSSIRVDQNAGSVKLMEDSLLPRSTS